MEPKRRIAVFLRLETEWDRKVVLGIAQYAQTYGPWEIQMAL
jgi:hypothetical protein